MNQITHIRHPSLSSKAARDMIGHRGESAFSALLSTIDSLADLHDGLAAVRANQSPLLTPEARAAAYKAHYSRAVARAQELVDAQVRRFVDFEEGVKQAAFHAAGLDIRPADAPEIRAALRAMSQKDRDAAIAKAIDRGDNVVIASVLNVSPILTGDITTPTDTLTRMLIDRAVPSLQQDLADWEKGLTALNLAAGGFRRSADQLRDPAAEDRAEAGEVAAQQASRQLATAMGN